jgi:hypothetical protein
MVRACGAVGAVATGYHFSRSFHFADGFFDDLFLSFGLMDIFFLIDNKPK